MTLPILYRDDDMVVVNKPSGLLVHRSALDRMATEFALQTVRDQIGQLVYSVHRLDRSTSGALIFALSPTVAHALMQKFANGQIEKSYLAVVRGVPALQTLVDYPLKERLDAKADKMASRHKAAQSAITQIERLATHEFPVQVDKYPASRYALVRAMPKTGRKHQIRRHLRHLGHPIIGDITYGSGKHNRFFATTFKIRRLLLACTGLAFPHPTSGQRLVIQAPLAPEYQELLIQIGWENANA